MPGNTPHENVLGHKNSENYRRIHMIGDSATIVLILYIVSTAYFLFCRRNFANSIKGINPQKKSWLRHLEEVIEELEGEGRTDEI